MFTLNHRSWFHKEVHPMLASHIKIHHHIYLKLIWTVVTCKQCLICAYFSPESDNFFTGENNIIYCILAVRNSLKLKKLFASQDVNWYTGVVWITCELLWFFYQLFELWRHPFTAEDPLVSKWHNAKFLQICSEKELTCISAGLSILGCTILLKAILPQTCNIVTKLYGSLQICFFVLYLALERLRHCEMLFYSSKIFEGLIMVCHFWAVPLWWWGWTEEKETSP